jgi:DNA polymerase-3 subunit epsilon
LAVAKITRADLESYEPMFDVYMKLIDMLAKYVDKFNKKDKFYLVGYNSASFDNPFFRAFFVQNGDNYFGSWFWSCPIDVMVLAGQYLIADRPSMLDFKQGTVAKHLGITVDDSKLHDAEYDIDICRKIYKAVIH